MAVKITLTKHDVTKAFARAGISVDVIEHDNKFIILGNEIINGNRLAVCILEASDLSKVVSNFSRELEDKIAMAKEHG